MTLLVVISLAAGAAFNSGNNLLVRAKCPMSTPTFRFLFSPAGYFRFVNVYSESTTPFLILSFIRYESPLSMSA